MCFEVDGKLREAGHARARLKFLKGLNIARISVGTFREEVAHELEEV
jgi:hypothetical protein